MRAIALLLPLLFAYSVTAAEIYKWTDDKGRVHYSDQPPPEGVASERRSIAQGTPTSSEPAKADAEDAAAAERARLCEQVQQSLKLLRENQNVMMDLDGDGKPEPLDAAAREEQALAAQRGVEEYCTPKAGG
ncbi:MAG: hypothetical protein KatS3mg126_0899 [Lysobacteraceae bacterium]|nr:MAG: hypothetical protein KatS3mg126_0899 [Xanthomonadaceae bacterium]